MSSATESEEDEVHEGIPFVQADVPSSTPTRKGRLRLKSQGLGDRPDPEATIETTENNTMAGGYASPKGSRRLRLRKQSQDEGSSDDQGGSHNGCGDNDGGGGGDGDGGDGREDGDDKRSSRQANIRKKQKLWGKNINLSCPDRKRNPLKFNIRDHGSCSLRGYRDFPHLMCVPKSPASHPREC